MPRSAEQLAGKTIAFLVAPEGVEQVELTDPWGAVLTAGATPELVSIATGTIQAFNHLDRGDSFSVDRIIDQVDADDYDGSTNASSDAF